MSTKKTAKGPFSRDDDRPEEVALKRESVEQGLDRAFKLALISLLIPPVGISALLNLRTVRKVGFRYLESRGKHFATMLIGLVTSGLC
ncbi:MAG: hypothetical protein V3W41_20565 [Planctomycetota bacterium]